MGVLELRGGMPMILRERRLPRGWYPDRERDVSAFLESLGLRIGTGRSLACVAPHAGWYYSGRIAAKAVASLAPAETILVMGGHLGRGSAPLIAEEDGAETPLGPLPMDAELRRVLRSRIRFEADRYGDNTVEVQLPLVKALFPKAKLLWLRLPAGPAAEEIGQAAAQAVRELGIRAVALGSSDLTHYGPNYGFQPHGLGAEALRWVREVNDKAFLDALLGGDGKAVLERAARDRSACSAGAALGARAFAVEAGASIGSLMEYGTSADAEADPRSIPDSFVGYAALSWSAA